MSKMEQRLKKVLKYFSFFAYDPTLDEIHTFFPIKISKEKLEKLIKAKKYKVILDGFTLTTPFILSKYGGFERSFDKKP